MRKEIVTHVPVEYVGFIRKKLSSVYVSGVPYKPNFSNYEEDLLLQYYIEHERGQREYIKEVSTFWKNFSVDIPADGVLLNIALNKDGYPVNVLDFLKYRFAYDHPFVAKNRSEMLEDSNKEFFIYDPVYEGAISAGSITGKMDTYGLFNKYIGNANYLKILLKGLRPSLNVANFSVDQLKIEISTLIEADYKQVLKVLKDKNVKKRAFISELVNNGIITTAGNSYFYDTKLLGDSVEQVIGFIDDSTNTEYKHKFIAMLKERSPSTTYILE